MTEIPAPEAALAGAARVSSTWLGLRESADAAARSTELLIPLRRRLAGASPVVVHDLGSGTGSMARWLAPQLPGPQHWILHDRDADLLERAVIDAPEKAYDGSMVTVETRRSDITRLTSDDFAEADLVTGSALLDMLTSDEADRVVAACVGTPALFTISVLGQVDLTPADPLDSVLAAAFNRHQRRTVAGRHLLGPDAAPAMAAAFTLHGVATTIRPSAWRLGPDDGDLIREWLLGWLAAACEQEPELVPAARAYAHRRLDQLVGGRMAAVIHHRDLLAGCG